MKLSVMYIWSNRGHTVSISQKLIVVPKNIQSRDSKTTFKPHMTCILLSVRLKLKETSHQTNPPAVYVPKKWLKRVAEWLLISCDQALTSESMKKYFQVSL